MIYKLANPCDLQDLPPMDSAVRDILLQYTTILSTEYGDNRDVDHEDGGYVLYATPDTTTEEVRKAFDPNGCVPEMVTRIDSCPAYIYTLYLLSSDYGVVLVAPASVIPSELLNQI